MTENPIYFYAQWKEHGHFSNFSNHPVKVETLDLGDTSVNFNGRVFPTSEHAFQAAKASAPIEMDQIMDAKTPAIALKLGRIVNLRPDWEKIKDKVMYHILKAKFTQHDDLKKALIETGTRKIIEHTTNDRYWADGGDGSGLNKLGLLLMRLRVEFQL